jgi:hypothetical protein
MDPLFSGRKSQFTVDEALPRNSISFFSPFGRARKRAKINPH